VLTHSLLHYYLATQLLYKLIHVYYSINTICRNSKRLDMASVWKLCGHDQKHSTVAVQICWALNGLTRALCIVYLCYLGWVGILNAVEPGPAVLLPVFILLLVLLLLMEVPAGVVIPFVPLGLFMECVLIPFDVYIVVHCILRTCGIGLFWR